MGIVTGLFRQLAPDLIDSLEAQGVVKGGGGLFDTKATPSHLPEMFIGGEGITNLGKAGLIDEGAAKQALVDAQKDWFKLPAEDWMKKWADTGIAYDPVANKAMLEISDKNVNIKKGIDIETLPEKDTFGFDELFNAETLKKAYPDIGNVKIGFLDEPYSPRLAGFDEVNNTVYFNRASPAWNPKEVKNNMLHEVQHFVQGKELFTKGEGFQTVLQNNADFQSVTSDLDKLVAQSSPDAVKFVKQNKGLNFSIDNVSEALGSLVARDGKSAQQVLAEAFKSKDMAKKFINAVTNDPKLSKILMAKDVASQEYQRSAGDYMRVAGETFARQTGERADMSGQERLINPAMRNIDVNPTNTAYDINLNNLTAPQIPQSSIPQASI